MAYPMPMSALMSLAGRLIFATRESLERLANPEQPAPSQPSDADLVMVFDNVERPGRDLTKFTKRSRRTLPLNSRTVAVIHTTACTFGVSKAARKRWAAKMGEDLALRYARLERFGDQLPYHYLITMDGLVVFNQPLDAETYHGHLGNRGIGIAVESVLPTFAKDFDPKRHRWPDPLFVHRGIVAAIRHAQARGCPIEQVQAHRNYHSSRAPDPGEQIWRQGVLPAVADLDLRIDYEAKAGSGRPIPREWDPRALFDWRGNRL